MTTYTEEELNKAKRTMQHSLCLGGGTYDVTQAWIIVEAALKRLTEVEQELAAWEDRFTKSDQMAAADAYYEIAELLGTKEGGSVIEKVEKIVKAEPICHITGYLTDSTRGFVYFDSCQELPPVGTELYLNSPAPSERVKPYVHDLAENIRRNIKHVHKIAGLGEATDLLNHIDTIAQEIQSAQESGEGE